jgi:Family of unknown function (DUF5898)
MKSIWSQVPQGPGETNPTLFTQSPAREMAPITPLPNSYSQQSAEIHDNGKRKIIRSEECFKSQKLVKVFVNAIFCGLDATFKPRTFLNLKEDQLIEMDAIRMNTKSYDWVTLKTKVTGITHPSITRPSITRPSITRTNSMRSTKNKDLFLVDYLGSGSTSVVYRALTLDGDDCVVKMIVAVADDKKVNTPKDLEKEMERKVTSEVNAYQDIYGSGFGRYVWKKTLNNFECVIMPFFEPIKKEQRELCLPEIKEILNKFKSKKVAYKECDQLWRHVGSFNNKIYLFDLGDLEKIRIPQQLEEKHKNHFNRLKEKALQSSVDSS